jgi:hypothetical protein
MFSVSKTKLPYQSRLGIAAHVLCDRFESVTLKLTSSSLAIQFSETELVLRRGAL